MFAQVATERQTDDSATDKQWMDNWTLLQLTNQYLDNGQTERQKDIEQSKRRMNKQMDKETFYSPTFGLRQIDRKVEKVHFNNEKDYFNGLTSQ